MKYCSEKDRAGTEGSPEESRDPLLYSDQVRLHCKDKFGLALEEMLGTLHKYRRNIFFIIKFYLFIYLNIFAFQV